MLPLSAPHEGLPGVDVVVYFGDVAGILGTDDDFVFDGAELDLAEVFAGALVVVWEC